VVLRRFLLTVWSALSLSGLLLMMGVSLSACSSSKSWKEEAQLHDGQKIIVERYFNLGSGLNIESRERRELDETVTFTLPGSNKKITLTLPLFSVSHSRVRHAACLS
jgi:hypothetical protein